MKISEAKNSDVFWISKTSKNTDFEPNHFFYVKFMHTFAVVSKSSIQKQLTLTPFATAFISPVLLSATSPPAGDGVTIRLFHQAFN